MARTRHPIDWKLIQVMSLQDFIHGYFSTALLNLFELEAQLKCGIFSGAHHLKNRENDNEIV